LIDTDKLRKTVHHFKFYSKPTSGSSSDPCTVGDIKKVVDKVAELFDTFIDELEENNN
jgi:hypothetical protein